ncbi:MAG: hypothetical protein ACRD2C_16520 [Acidimicrobiales bacterium]
MSNGTGWLVAALLLLALAIRRPALLLMIVASLVVFWDFGLIGVGVLWAVVWAVVVSCRWGAPRASC